MSTCCTREVQYLYSYFAGVRECGCKEFDTDCMNSLIQAGYAHED